MNCRHNADYRELCLVFTLYESLYRVICTKMHQLVAHVTADQLSCSFMGGVGKIAWERGWWSFCLRICEFPWELTGCSWSRDACLMTPPGNTLCCRAIASMFSQRLLHKMTNSSAVFTGRIHARSTSKFGQENSILSLDITGKFVDENVFVTT